MVFGAFDGLHPGHLDFFRQAKKYGDFLTVSVARDINVRKIKGREPLFSEEERLELVASLKIVDKAVLGAAHNFYIHIKVEKPDVICLGYDQWAQDKEVIIQLREVGLLNTQVIRLNPYKENRAKSTIVKRKSIDFS